VTIKTKTLQLDLEFLLFEAEHGCDVRAQFQKGIDIHRLKIEMSFSHDVTPSKSQSVIDLATSKASTRALRLSPLARIPSADGLRPAHGKPPPGKPPPGRQLHLYRIPRNWCF
jgi:hypothetical protein